MPDIDKYFDEIDVARARRARELSEIKFRFTSNPSPDPSSINSRAVIVLTYANWEGFYNECVRAYIRFLKQRGGKVRVTDWMLLLGALRADFESLRDRNHSDDARQEFVSNLRSRLDCGFEAIDGSVIEARSNLDFARLRWNFAVLDFDLTPLQRFRIRMDRELVQWRHSVAHGDPPDLTALDINGHVEFAATLLITLADGFQEAMLRRI
ncbi:MAG: MAE_28990/MAE_18760 family HEPN-like nuclease [Bryobacteraceae bacterium]